MSDMPFLMDAAALTVFLDAEFPQISEEFTVHSAGPGEAALRLDPRTRHLRPGGTVSGPTLFALADVAFYAAVLTAVGPKALAVTTNCSIDFLRKPAAGAPLLGHARILKLGRRLVVGDVVIRPEGQAAAVARAGLTYSIPAAG